MIDWIWHVGGRLPLRPDQSADRVFDAFDPILREPGTSHERSADTLVFRKKDPAAQDPLSVFDLGVLTIETGTAGPLVLRYRLASRALLFCFLAPLLFLFFGQLTLALAGPHKPASENATKSGKAAQGKSGTADKPAVAPMNPIDKALGAPRPDPPKTDKGGHHDKPPSATPAYVFAAIFAALYVVGRILEDRLVRRLFSKRLAAAGCLRAGERGRPGGTTVAR